MPEWSHPITLGTTPSEDCSDRIYTLTGTAIDAGVITLDEATRTLEVMTNDPYNVGTYSLTITVDIADRPFLIPLLTVSTSLTITITSPCETTTLQPNVHLVQ